MEIKLAYYNNFKKFNNVIVASLSDKMKLFMTYDFRLTYE